MIKVVVGGATGKLGSLVCGLIEQQKDMGLTAGVVSAGRKNIARSVGAGVPLYGADRIIEAVENADIYVDLTSPAATEKNLPLVMRKNLNYVVGTTSISAPVMDLFMRTVRDNNSSAVVTPNFSVGVNVFFKTCQSLAKALPGYDVEIIEVHHNQKKDAPSGTAKRAAQIISETTSVDKLVYGREGNVGARGKEIAIHSVRAGDVVGEHTVIFAGNKERIELTHRAHSRETFAEGCVMAIRWIAGRKDGQVHTMNEVLGL
jgi:4-hydroxy-tetrahydrodipicolinate reductase